MLTQTQSALVTADPAFRDHPLTARGAIWSNNHPRAHSDVGQAINHNKGTGGAVGLVIVQRKWRIEADFNAAHLIELQAAGAIVCQRIHIHLVLNGRDVARNIAGGTFEIITFAGQQRLFAEPHQHGVKMITAAHGILRAND